MCQTITTIMGKFKRTKQRPRKEKEVRFCNTKMVLEFIERNKERLYSLPINIIQIEEREIEYGDEWDSKSGLEYLMFFENKDAFIVGSQIHTEDGEDWAQPETHEEFICRDYYWERNVEPLEVMEKLEAIVSNKTI